MKRVGYSNKMIVHPMESDGSVSFAYSSYDPFLKIATIGIPRDPSLQVAEICWMCLHELGHLSNHHPEFFVALLAVNFFLVSLPYFSLKTVFSSLIISFCLSLLLFPLMERQADAFAFKHSTLEELERLKLLTKNRKPLSQDRMVGFLLEKFFYRSEERRSLLDEAILKKRAT